jgi:hypothetical protein
MVIGKDDENTYEISLRELHRDEDTDNLEILNSDDYELSFEELYDYIYHILNENIDISKISTFLT